MKQSRNSLQEIIAARKNGELVGVYSVCSANPRVIEASVKFAALKEIPLLIEATCNQVNQFGGYTGMLPDQFAKFVWELVEKHHLNKESVTLGGDHLGPFPWQNDPVKSAMQKAKQMVHDYICAGYTKIHLDASMKCADDDPGIPLDMEISATRAAEMCAVAEKAVVQSGRTNQIVYVIGTEVPRPGGVEIGEDDIQVTVVEDVRETIDITKKAFLSRGLEQAWERVIAVVVQPGVEFGDNVIYNYERERAKKLSEFIGADKQLVFEAHSTDYQTGDALRQMVEDNFTILKVGPELTFTYREAVFALELIETELFGGRPDTKLSNLRKVVDTVMLDDPSYWQKYYRGRESEQVFARKYSFSDRIRYYWPNHKIQVALKQLFVNLESIDIPTPLLSQYLPVQYQKILQHGITKKPVALIEDKIKEILLKYASACGFG